MVPQNHQLRQRNSKFHSGCIFPFSDVNLISSPILLTCPEKAQLGEKFATVCNQGSVWKIPTWRKWKYQTYSNRSEFTDQKGNGIANKSIFKWKIQRALYVICISLRSISLEKEKYISLCENIHRSAVWSPMVSRSRLVKRLELHQDLQLIFHFLEQIKSKSFKNFRLPVLQNPDNFLHFSINAV